ncbi:MAG: ATP-binding cassette domain-containing protein, partial [Alphaproteobacteria bacterium]|nr:ATP-binding cassette domain-containing protein [Alphaproteobacteria bacterium]
MGDTAALVHALSDVSFSVAPGEAFGLVGESGCGKTTVARTLMGLERPTRGQVLYDGEPLNYRIRALRRYRRAVQLVLQDPTGSLNPH